jgi:hypothetical protein
VFIRWPDAFHSQFLESREQVAFLISAKGRGEERGLPIYHHWHNKLLEEGKSRIQYTEACSPASFIMCAHHMPPLIMLSSKGPSISPEYLQLISAQCYVRVAAWTSIMWRLRWVAPSSLLSQVKHCSAFVWSIM